MSATPPDPLFGLSPAALKEVKRRDLVIRFCFGATISTIAGVVATFAGTRISGVLLAFPVILPATLTLIEREDSKRDAEEDDVGSILGAVSLVAFAVLAWVLLPRVGAAAALEIAALAWLALSVALYVALRELRRRRGDLS